MKEEFFKYTFAGMVDFLSQFGNLEDRLKMLGYDMGKRMIIKTNFQREADVQYLLYKIAFELLPHFYSTSRKIQKRLKEDMPQSHTSDFIENGQHIGTPSSTDLTNQDMLYDTYLLTENVPFFNKYISMSETNDHDSVTESLCCDSIVCGVIECALVASNFKSVVIAYNAPSKAYPDRVIYEIKIHKGVPPTIEL